MDNKTAEIDALIAKKEELLKLLAEQRTTLITHAVTKGLNSDAPMKDSGVPWLGQVPVGWGIIKLGHYLISLKDGTHGTHARVDEGPYLLSAKNIQDDELIYSDLDSRISEEEFVSINKNGSFKAGDVLLTIVGTLGRSAIYPVHEEKISFQRSVATLRPISCLYNRFLMYSLQADSSQKQLLSKAKQSAQLGVYLSDISTMNISLPSLNTQKTIAGFLDNKTAEIDALQSKVETAIERLNEHRTALITHAVTGKIKVV
ncbi:MAG: restriction endonuclease subunit S [Alphaproteobacteria bacterium]|nr:restriction endonuclease subunit S [Alphaproteobacteria bacterium]